MSKNFVHLHNHSHFSLLDALSKVDEMVKRCKELEMPAISLTDHGNLSGAVQLWRECKKEGVKPIIGCLVKGQEIITDQGIKTVENIQVGDKVLTHRGRFRQVKQVFSRQYKGDLFEFNLGQNSNRRLIVTEEHPILTLKNGARDPSWLLPAEITPGRMTKKGGLKTWNSYVCFPKLEQTNVDQAFETVDTGNYLRRHGFLIDSDSHTVYKPKAGKYTSRYDWYNIPQHVQIDRDMGYFLGLFCAEGSFGTKAGQLTGSCTLTFSAQEHKFADWCGQFLSERFGLSVSLTLRGDKNIEEVHFCCKPLAHLLAEMCGRGAHNKKVPTEIMVGHGLVRTRFLQGLFDGDGHYNKETGQNTLHTASRNLAWQVKTLLASRDQWTQVTKTGKMHYQVRYQECDTYSRCLADDRYIYHHIKNIRKIHNQNLQVYNFAVEEDESYVSDFVLHNCELYVATQDMTLKQRIKNQRNYHHLVVLAMNAEGYRNLCYLVSRSFIDGFYYKPRVDKALLAKHSKGLFASTACMIGEVAQALWHNADQEDALNHAAGIVSDLHGIFGDNLRIELQDHGIEEQELINTRAIQLSKETGVPLVFTNDCHFIYESDFEPHKALKCIQTRDPLTTADHVYRPDHRLKTRQEMEEIVARYPMSLQPLMLDALDETVKIADRCDFEFTKGTYYFPEVELDKGKTLHETFEAAVLEGFKWRSPKLQENRGAEYVERLCYEMSLIHRMDFEGYFLIVADFIRHARSQGIAVGPGRGSAAGSLVSYCLGITNVDPLAHGLLFERFLNPARISMPDIDIDFSKRRRHEVIDYVVEKYGRDNVAQIVTFGSLKPRAVLNDLGRVHQLEIPETRAFSHLIPDTPGKPYTLERAQKEIPEVNEAMARNPQLKDIWKNALRLEDTHRHNSIHAAGLVITPEPVHHYAPMHMQTKSKDVAAAYDMNDLETIGLVKMDFLGLKTLDLITDCVDIIRKTRGINIDIDDVDLTDDRVIKLFARGDTKGVFQFESTGLRQALQRLAPTHFSDLVAMNALYRPGPMGKNPDTGRSMMDDYIDSKNGKRQVDPVHPELKDILSTTHNVIVFQEQIMKAVQVLAGHELGPAYLFLKAVAKKDAKLFKIETQKVMDGGLAKGRTKEEMQRFLDAINEFARYCFNVSHSVAYTYVGFQTAYLKAYYPLEFMAALLTNETEDNKPEKVHEYVGDCKVMDIDVLPPDVNYSETMFSVEQESIRYGLGAIKNVGHSVCEDIIRERQTNGEYKSLPDLLHRVNLRSTAVEALISAGATDSLGGNRATHMENYPRVLSEKRKYKTAEGQINLFDELGETQRIIELGMTDLTEWDKRERNSREKEYLGMWLTGHPLDEHKDKIKQDIVTLKSMGEDERNIPVELVGVVTSFIKRRTRKNNKTFGILTLEDLSGSGDFFLLWGDAVHRCEQALEIDNVVRVKGKTSPYDGNMRVNVRDAEVI